MQCITCTSSYSPPPSKQLHNSPPLYSSPLPPSPAHLHCEVQVTPPSKHSQYFLMQRDLRQRQPVLWEISPLPTCSH